jgi:predicted HTH transcriptional regulator
MSTTRTTKREVLAFIAELEKQPEMREIAVIENKKLKKVEKRPYSTKESIMKNFEMKNSTAAKHLTNLDRAGLIKADYSRSYYVSNRKERTHKWVYKLTDAGRKFDT